MPYIPGGGKIRDVYSSNNVYANGVRIALWQPPGGEAAFFAAQGLSINQTFIDIPETQYAADDVDADNVDFDNIASEQTRVDTAIAQGQSQGIVTSNTVPATTPIVIQNDPTPATTGAGTIFYTATDFISYNASEYPRDNAIYSTLNLTPSTPLSEFTTQTVLWNGGDPKWLKSQHATSVSQILANMANLAKNCWEPIKAKYPNAVITNVFRQGSSTTQHSYGMAMDIQFKNIAATDYFGIAQWIRDNVNFDQLILEKAANAPWIHISFYSGFGPQVALKPANRVATMIVGSPTTFFQGLQQIA